LNWEERIPLGGELGSWLDDIDAAFRSAHEQLGGAPLGADHN